MYKNESENLENLPEYIDILTQVVVKKCDMEEIYLTCYHIHQSLKMNVEISMIQRKVRDFGLSVKWKTIS